MEEGFLVLFVAPLPEKFSADVLDYSR